jgi:hypothetical protein
MCSLTSQTTNIQPPVTSNPPCSCSETHNNTITFSSLSPRTASALTLTFNDAPALHDQLGSNRTHFRMGTMPLHTHTDTRLTLTTLSTAHTITISQHIPSPSHSPQAPNKTKQSILHTNSIHHTHLSGGPRQYQKARRLTDLIYPPGAPKQTRKPPSERR